MLPLHCHLFKKKLDRNKTFWNKYKTTENAPTAFNLHRHWQCWQEIVNQIKFELYNCEATANHIFAKSSSALTSVQYIVIHINDQCHHYHHHRHHHFHHHHHYRPITHSLQVVPTDHQQPGCVYTSTLSCCQDTNTNTNTKHANTNTKLNVDMNVWYKYQPFKKEKSNSWILEIRTTMSQTNTQSSSRVCLSEYSKPPKLKSLGSVMSAGICAH